MWRTLQSENKRCSQEWIRLLSVSRPACKQTQTHRCICISFFFCFSHTQKYTHTETHASSVVFFLWLFLSLSGHLLIPINHELSCIVSSASPSPLLYFYPPFTFSLSLNKLWHHDSDVCATEWCLAAAPYWKGIEMLRRERGSDEIVFLSSLWQNVKMAALPGYSIKFGR